MKKNILYLHGFNSSPLSVKAEQARLYFAKHHPEVKFFCPQLEVTPAKVVAQLESIITGASNSEQWLFIGSSLGGYFSSYLAEKYNGLAVLVNPAIKPFELMHDYLGEHVNPYTQEVYQVNHEHISQLKEIESSAPSANCKQKNNYLVMVQTGDEVLNYQQAVEKYQHARLIVQEGGDHSFINFEQCLPTISHFFQLD